jgi:deazaflavin-dependent oxidoreductase (nitroreductase family)
MKESPRIPLFFWRGIRRVNQRMLSSYGLKSKVANRVLVLVTIGRKSGQPRSTPLQYEEVEGVYYVASVRGVHADWYRNLLASPKVDVQVVGMCFSTNAKPMTDVGQITDFLELRLKRHPHFIGTMLRLEGLPRKYTRIDIEKLAKRLAIVALPKDISETLDN